MRNIIQPNEFSDFLTNSWTIFYQKCVNLKRSEHFFYAKSVTINKKLIHFQAQNLKFDIYAK